MFMNLEKSVPGNPQTIRNRLFISVSSGLFVSFSIILPIINVFLWYNFHPGSAEGG
jgi:hypothetical protein